MRKRSPRLSKSKALPFIPNDFLLHTSHHEEVLPRIRGKHLLIKKAHQPKESELRWLSSPGPIPRPCMELSLAIVMPKGNNAIDFN
jgi:hypothetical protein